LSERRAHAVESRHMSTGGDLKRGRTSRATRGRFFTVESANGALVFVRQVVRDVVQEYDELMRLRSEQQELSLARDVHEQLEGIRARIEQKVERLKKLHRELADVGCALKDLVGGLVDFPAMLDGRRVLLCWKLGEPEVAFWHEVRAGYAGRRPIDDKFRARLRDTQLVS
jgi:hypothetical protein